MLKKKPNTSEIFDVTEDLHFSYICQIAPYTSTINHWHYPIMTISKYVQWNLLRVTIEKHDSMTFSSFLQVKSNAESLSWSFQHYFWPVLSDHLSYSLAKLAYLFKLYNFCAWTKENVSSWVSCRQKSRPWLDNSCRSCLVRVYFICKRCKNVTLGYNELTYIRSLLTGSLVLSKH